MKIKIIYETMAGTTQYVAEILQRELTELGHQVTLHSLKYQGLAPDLTNLDLVLIGAPTYDDGLLEVTMRGWIKEFHPSFANLKLAVFGLGNRTYPQFCKAADLLEEWVKTNNGQLIIESLRIDHFPDDVQPIVEWAQKLNVALGSGSSKVDLQPQTR